MLNRMEVQWLTSDSGYIVSGNYFPKHFVGTVDNKFIFFMKSWDIDMLDQ